MEIIKVKIMGKHTLTMGEFITKIRHGGKNISNLPMVNMLIMKKLSKIKKVCSIFENIYICKPLR